MKAPAFAQQAPRPIVDREPRCRVCGKMLAYYLARPWKLLCSRCRVQNESPPGPVIVSH